jgi:SAM-dependent methyltransferase
MYMPDHEQAMREIQRVLRPGGRVVVAVWGERRQCGWSAVFPIVDAEVSSEVCPLFFQLGYAGALTALCEQAGLVAGPEHRISAPLHYADAEAACDAAFVGGPVAMAWSRFDAPTRRRVQQRYVQAISGWKQGEGFRVPGEFVLISAKKPGAVL